MVFDQKKGISLFGHQFRHVTLGDADSHEASEFFLQRKVGCNLLEVGRDLVLVPGSDDLLHSALAKGSIDGIDEREAEFSVGLRK